MIERVPALVSSATVSCTTSSVELKYVVGRLAPPTCIMEVGRKLLPMTSRSVGELDPAERLFGLTLVRVGATLFRVVVTYWGEAGVLLATAR